MSAFEKDSPAPTVEALLEFLRTEHLEGDLYRGQIHEYPALVPSMLRPGLDPNSADQKIVPIDPEKIFRAHASKADDTRRELHAMLLSNCGIAIGNIIAQQYGIRSECVDVTEDLCVAGFFATRNWPVYSHHDEPGIGVVYRFRRKSKMPPPSYRHLKLDSWFELGEWEGKYFEVLVHLKDYEGESLDRDKWVGLIPPQSAVVSTLPLRMGWQDVHELLQQLNDRQLQGLWTEIPKYDHRLTRTFRQSGGFIRPRFYWEAEIPSRWKLLNSEPRFRPNPFHGMPEFDESAPRVLPSTAIKKKLIGVENLRLRDDCEAFYFRHGKTKITGMYRRKLWPEPAEDPLYALLWLRAAFLMPPGDDGEIAPVDDLANGAVDRGYRVKGERRTRDARELDDLARGQLEDAQEAVASGSAKSRDWVLLSGALFENGYYPRCLDAALSAVRCDPRDIPAGISLAGALWSVGRMRWACRVLANVELLDPTHPAVLYNIARAEIAHGDYSSAFPRLKKALNSLEPAIHDVPRYMVLDDILFVAEKIGDKRAAEFASLALERYARGGGVIVDSAQLE